MRTELIKSLGAILFMTLLGGALVFLLAERSRADAEAIAFYRSALGAADISESVTIRGETYRIDGGNISGERGRTITTSEELPILETAYALALARNSPLFGIAGTNPASLRQAVGDLKDVVRKLAMTQSNAGDAKLIASSLYPIDFLDSLTALEGARLQFLSSGKDSDERAYNDAMILAVRAGERDTRNTEKELQKMTSGENMKFVGLNGTMTTGSMLSAIAAIREGFARNEARRLDRARCVAGDSTACVPEDLFMPVPPEDTSLSPASIPPLVREIRALIATAQGRTSVKNPHATVVLEKSSCLGALPGPYYMSVQARSDNGTPAFEMNFNGDMFFHATGDSNGAVNQYENTELGISYSPINPVVFYLCPEVGSDRGAAYGILMAVAFARAHPELAATERARLLKNPSLAYEGDAASYLRSAAAEFRKNPGSFPAATRDAFLNVLLMFSERSGGLEYLVEDIAQTNANDLRIKAAGVPFDVSARTMFLTHTAFPSLFLAHNPSTGVAPLTLAVKESADLKELLSQTARYSSLRLTLPPDEITANVRAYLIMEGKISGAQPTREPAGYEPACWLNYATILQPPCLRNVMARIPSFFSPEMPRTAQTVPGTEKEIIAIKNTSDLSEQTRLYRQLIERVGLVAAQEDLYRSGLPFDGQSHLLNHESGDYAYQKYGSAGIAYCKDYFLESCYHGIILDIIAHEGFIGLQHIPGCWNAGDPLAIQCAHGIGHGLLAWVGYKNLPQALALCDELKASIANFPAFNCYDGVFMENIWAVHENGTPSPDHWVKADDPYYPCDDSRIKDEWELGCWANQPSLLYSLQHTPIGTISSVCESLGNDAYRTQCFEGLARQIHPLAEGNARDVAALCGEVASAWRDFCQTTVAYTEYAVGGRTLPFVVCAEMDGGGKENCYGALADAIRSYSTSPGEEETMCAQIPETVMRIRCKNP